MGNQRLLKTGKTVICGNEYTIDELKKGIRNPFYDKLVKEVVVPVRREDYVVFEEVASTKIMLTAEKIVALRELLPFICSCFTRHPLNLWQLPSN